LFLSISQFFLQALLQAKLLSHPNVLNPFAHLRKETYFVPLIYFSFLYRLRIVFIALLSDALSKAEVGWQAVGLTGRDYTTTLMEVKHLN
jgi:hypothetical protein